MKLKRLAILVMTALFLLSLSALAEGASLPFYSAEGFTLTIHEGVQAIGFDTKHWVSVEEGMPVPDDVVIDNTFSWIKRIRFPSTLRYLGAEALYGFSVSTLELPEGFETFADGALVYCDIGTLKLPSTFLIPSGTAFVSNDVANVEVSPNNFRLKTVDGVLYSKDGETLYYYPSMRVETHYDVPAGVLRIADSAFSGNDYLQSISLPLGLEVIGRNAFSECGRLVSVALPLTLEEIGEYAFADCVSLQRVSPPPGLALITSVFYNCPLLTGAPEWQGDDGGNEQVYSKQITYWPDRDGNEIVYSGNGRNAVYKAPDVTSPHLASLADGAHIRIDEFDGEWAKIAWHSWEKGWSEESDEKMGYIHLANAFPYSSNELFTLFDIKPLSPETKVYDAPFVNAADLPGKPISIIPSQDFRVEQIIGNWLAFLWAEYTVEDDGWLNQGATTVYASARDFSYTRVNCGDGRTLCLVLPEEGVEPLLNTSGPELLAQLVGGTQAEVIKQGAEHTLIRVNGQEGYVRTGSVYVVPEALE